MDPDFGLLRFMHISQYPERSYWECEWTVPPLGTVLSIGLPGSEAGPLPESRKFFLDLVERIDGVKKTVKPQLVQAYRSFSDADPPDQIDDLFVLTGFDVKDPRVVPLQWSVSFETTGESWL